MKPKIIFILILFPIFSFSQKFIVYDLDTTNFPEFSAKYLVFNEKNELIEDVYHSDFEIKLGQKDLKIDKLTPPKRSKEVQKASIILTIDVSGSMGGKNIELAKEAAITFINMTPLYSCEIAVTTFDDGNYINMDFTKNKEKLIKSVGKIRALGGTNYDQGLISQPAGALEIMNNAQYEKKIVIFLTDGLGTGNHSQIIMDAKNKGATVYPITVNMPMPQVLDKIAEGTDGETFEKVIDVDDAKEVYIKILSEIMETEPGEIYWKIKPLCEFSNTNLVLSYKELNFNVPYTFPKEMIISLNPNTDLIDFGAVPVGDTAYNKITFKAKNSSFKIFNLKSTKPDEFKIYPPNDYPFVVPKNKSVEFIVKYIPQDTNFISDKIKLETDGCKSGSVLLYGGNPPNNPLETNLEVVFPNGGEKLGIASLSNVNWDGVSKYDSVIVSLSVDSGKTYQNLGIGSNLNFFYNVPNKMSNSCLMKVTHKMLSYKQYEPKLTMNSNQAVFLKEDGQVFISGRQFVGVMNIRKSFFNSVYTPQKSMNSVKLSPDESHFITVNNDQISIKNTSDFREEISIDPVKLVGVTLKKVHKKNIVDACYSSDGSKIISIDRKGEMKLWDVATGKNIEKNKTDINYLKRIENIPDTNLITIFSRKEIYIYNSDNLEFVQKIEADKEISDICFYNNSTEMLLVNKYGKLEFYETNNWEKKSEIELEKDKVSRIELESSLERIAILHNKAVSIYVFPEMIHQFDITYERRINNIDFSNNGTQIVTSAGRAVPVWSAYKRAEQSDISDDFFSIEGGMPYAKTVIIPTSYVTYNTSEYVTDFLYNPNGYEIAVKDIQFVGEDATKFGLVSGFPPFKIKPYSGKNVEFSYNSNEEGKDNAKILIITYSDTLITTISAEAKPIPFQLTNKYIDFGTLKKNEQKHKKVSVMKNVSSEDLIIENVYQIGGEEGHFVLHNELKGQIIKPGQDLFIDATYKATVPRRSTVAYKLVFQGVSQAITISMKGNCYVPKNVLLHGIVTDMLTTKPIAGTIKVFDVETGVMVGGTGADERGNYKIRLSMDRKHKVVASANGYTSKDTIIDLTEFVSVDKMKKSFVLEPDFSQTDIVIMNLLFDTDKFSLKQSEKQKMSGLIKFIKNQKDLNIEIYGHTDNEGDDDHNLQLSKNRANSVKNHLIAMGVNSSRIKTEGFGATKPISDNQTEEGKQENRRVEIKFVN